MRLGVQGRGVSSSSKFDLQLRRNKTFLCCMKHGGRWHDFHLVASFVGAIHESQLVTFRGWMRMTCLNQWESTKWNTYAWELYLRWDPVKHIP